LALGVEVLVLGLEVLAEGFKRVSCLIDRAVRRWRDAGARQHSKATGRALPPPTPLPPPLTPMPPNLCSSALLPTSYSLTQDLSHRDLRFYRSIYTPT
jgi:hypothetical protein